MKRPYRVKMSESEDNKDREIRRLSERVDHIEKRQEEQSASLRRIEAAVVGDEELGRQGIGKTVRDHDDRLERLERFQRNVTKYGKWIGGILSAGATVVLYHWPKIWEMIRNFFNGTGKA